MRNRVELTRARKPGSEQASTRSRCAVCHGANLQGESGTPLTGPTFFAGIWRRNGCTAVRLHQPPDASRRARELEPAAVSRCDRLYSVAKRSSRRRCAVEHRDHSVRCACRRCSPVGPRRDPTTDEIVRAAPPTRNVYAQLPAGANVNVSDSMMLNAGIRREQLAVARPHLRQPAIFATQADYGRQREVSQPGGAGSDRDDGELRDDADRRERRDVHHDAGRQPQDDDHGDQCGRRASGSGT